jgi:tetratricopeptide (TPR) repeat protein
MTPVTEAERHMVADQLKNSFQIRSRPAEQVQKYADKILSGNHDVWMQQVAACLRNQSQDIFAGLDDSTDDKVAQTPDLPTLLLIQDENDRRDSIASREGKPRESKDAKALLAKFEELDEPSSRNERRFAAIHEPYSPCTVSVHDLKTIKLADLTQETHHRGKAISLRRVGTLKRHGVAIVGIVEDDGGDRENIELHHITKEHAEYIATSDSAFKLKEPYFTTRLDGSSTLSIDHPTDVLSSIKNKSLSSVETEQNGTKSAADWKQAGNDLLGKKQLWKARESYQAGLSQVTEEDHRLKLDLSRNLARVDLDLGRYDEAKTSALAAVSDGADANIAKLDVKAYYRAASGAYNLRQFDEAEQCLDKLLKLDLNDSDGKRDRQRVRSRLGEAKKGSYDFDKVVGRLSPQNPRADIADFQSRVEVRKSQLGGRGLFASADFQTGDLVLCEKAFCSSFEKDATWYAAWEYSNGRLSLAASTMSLWDEMVQRLANNPSAIAGLTGLTGDYKGLGSKKVEVDGDHIIDVFQIRSIIDVNAFGIPTPSKQRSTRPFGFTAEFMEQTQLGDNTGLFLKTAMMNHSCVPNTRKVFVGDSIVIRATRPIKKGEEILQSYAQTDADVGERRQMLSSTWHFDCKCKLCSAEEKETEEKRNNRDTLERRANQLGMAIKNSSASMQEVAKADVLLKSLKGSYDAELYKNLPRKAGAYLYIGLIRHYMRQNQRSRCIATTISLFDTLGWTISIGNDKAELDRKDDSETHIMPELVDAVLIARSLQLSTGKSKSAGMLEKIASELYLAVNGVDCGWQQLLKSKA